jgi:hypothetical protein
MGVASQLLKQYISSEIQFCGEHEIHVVSFLSPLRGLVLPDVLPTACAVGCILAPLRGWEPVGLRWISQMFSE